jgi:hypothetical protein
MAAVTSALAHRLIISLAATIRTSLRFQVLLTWWLLISARILQRTWVEVDVATRRHDLNIGGKVPVVVRERAGPWIGSALKVSINWGEDF